MREVSLKTPAKINLFLETISKRPDGYHNLLTLFARVALFDRLVLRKSRSGHISVRVKNNSNLFLKDRKDNLAYKAAEAFFKTFGINCGVEIELEKNIPAGAGLGGGSGNAAGVLKGLCGLFETDFRANYDKILKIALSIGADVPFFLQDECFCAARGMGEKLSPVKASGVLPSVIIAWPGEPVSTKYAYSKLKLPVCREVRAGERKFRSMMRCLKDGARLEAFKKFMFNRLEDPVLENFRFVRNLKDRFRKLGADSVLMSGSGSSIFALIEETEKAGDVFKRMKMRKGKVFLTHFLLKS
ncbi:MAG: 4-(cytidine 5'-diphospho)-2-C-methyl-D-erythritol kinase [Elusimicrobia bacterium]|nr:4-(cytidine 5'-diphospho)-2-C-methyl-D-erythritol kinase [Elusimicrobiota bacterium]